MTLIVSIQFSRYNDLGLICKQHPPSADVAVARLLRNPAMGLSGLEPPTSRLSGVRSNRLSYKP